MRCRGSSNPAWRGAGRIYRLQPGQAPIKRADKGRNFRQLYLSFFLLLFFFFFPPGRAATLRVNGESIAPANLCAFFLNALSGGAFRKVSPGCSVCGCLLWAGIFVVGGTERASVYIRIGVFRAVEVR